MNSIIVYLLGVITIPVIAATSILLAELQHRVQKAKYNKKFNKKYGIKRIK